MSLKWKKLTPNRQDPCQKQSTRRGANSRGGSQFYLVVNGSKYCLSFTEIMFLTFLGLYIRTLWKLLAIHFVYYKVTYIELSDVVGWNIKSNPYNTIFCSNHLKAYVSDFFFYQMQYKYLSICPGMSSENRSRQRFSMTI